MEPVWPDLVKFCIIGQILKLFGNILRVYLVLGENSNFFGKQLSQSSNFQCFKFPIIKTNLATWSHWMELTEWLKRKEAESFLQFFSFSQKMLTHDYARGADISERGQISKSETHIILVSTFQNSACSVWPDCASYFCKALLQIILQK